MEMNVYVIWEESSNDSWQFSASFTSTSQLSLLPFSSTETKTTGLCGSWWMISLINFVSISIKKRKRKKQKESFHGTFQETKKIKKFKYHHRVWGLALNVYIHHANVLGPALISYIQKNFNNFKHDEKVIKKKKTHKTTTKKQNKTLMR